MFPNFLPNWFDQPSSSVPATPANQEYQNRQPQEVVRNYDLQTVVYMSNINFNQGQQQFNIPPSPPTVNPNEAPLEHLCKYIFESLDDH